MTGTAIDRPPAIVFTDLDGTLLDHETYTWLPAEQALWLLHDKRVPVVLASSKTAAEIAPLREEIGFADCPAIVENGSGILEPGEPAAGDRNAHDAILSALAVLPAKVRSRFSGFSDWSIEELAERTGLPRKSAALASRRRFSEPGIWAGNEDERVEFERLLGESGIFARQGGRYLTLSFGATKADRMREIKERYGNPFTIALGDAPNDIEMLQAADTGVVVVNPDGKSLPGLEGEAEGRIIRTEKAGPAGWNDAILRIFKDNDF